MSRVLGNVCVDSYCLRIIRTMLYKAGACPFIVPTGKPADVYWKSGNIVANELNW